MDILGISAFYHDAAAALLRDGIPLAAAQEERFSRHKHDASFPRRAIRYCLREARIHARDLDYVVFYEKPLRRFERILATQLQAFPRSAKAFSKAMFLWLGDRLWLKNRIASELGIDPSRILFTEHHQSHAASAFFASPFEEAAVLVADGVGEWATTTLARGHGSSLELLEEIRFPHSLGLFYSAVTAFLGFRVNDGEHKVMGLASYGRPRYSDELARLVHFEDGAYTLDLSAFRFTFDPDKSFGEGLTRILGPPRAPEDPVLYQGKDSRHADIAASLQRVLEDSMLTLLHELKRRVPSENLCLAGGVGLNVVANARLLKEGPFQRLFVQPAAGDAGGALGAALHVWHAQMGKPRAYRMEHAFLGESVRPAPDDGALTLDDEDKRIDRMVDALLKGQTIGWVRDRFEWGPRSLGHRTLLADPRRPNMRDHINSVIKRRELFRPLAPAVAAEQADRYFIVPSGGESPARFMLLSTDTHDDAVEKIPSVLHIDRSARVQLVHAEVDPLFHRLLTRFGEASGVPVLLNTSLNGRGEPIVRGERDALELLHRSQLDMLVVEDRIYTSTT